jgi:Protein of unknown function (DUF1266)
MGLFKFIKDAIKEGVEEGKAELAVEKSQKDAEQEAQQEIFRQKLAGISAEELFAVSLGAPYRQTFMPDLGDAQTQNRPAYYLCGMDVQESNRDPMKKLLERDFSVRDRTSLLHMAMQTQALMYCAFSMKGEDPQSQLLEEQTRLFLRAIEQDRTEDWEAALNEARATISQAQLQQGSAEQRGQVVLWMSRLAYAATVSVGLGYIDKAQVLELLKPMIQTGLGVVSSWQEFAELFLLGDKADGSNNFLGRKVIGMHIKKLLEDERSPWVTHPWRSSASS